MSYSTSNKIKLLQSASALILGATAVTAHAQSVSTTATDVTLANTVDALVVVDQSVSASSGTTATANDANVKSGNDVDVTESSVLITGSTTAATAINNTSSQSLNDSGAAATSRTSGISVEQDNASSATAQTGSATDGTEVKISIDETLRSPLTISGSVNRASATGNTASTAVSTTDFTTNSTNATLGAMQQNTGATGVGNIAVTATVNDTDINLQAGATTTSDLTVSGNTDAAVATANSLTQNMTLTGTTLTLGTVSATANTAPSGTAPGAGIADVDASGAALLSSRQTNTFTDVSAANTASSITLVAGATNGSSLDVNSNTQAATATGSAAGNVLALSGTTVGTGAAIVSAQTSDAQSSVTAGTTGQAGITVTSLGVTTASSASLTDNMLQSRATGGTVTNRLTADATTITLQAADTVAAAIISNSALTSDTSLSGTVSGAYASLNDQFISGAVTATTGSAAAEVTKVTFGGLTAGQTATFAGRTFTSTGVTTAAELATVFSTAQGATVTGGTITGTAVGTASAAGAVLTHTSAAGDVTDLTVTGTGSGSTVAVTTQGTANAGFTVATTTAGLTNGSSINNDRNAMTAQAQGAVAANTTILAVGGTLSQASAATTEVANAAVIANIQELADTAVVSATVDTAGAQSVLTSVTGVLSSSSVSTSDNRVQASADGASASNALTASATTLTTPAGPDATPGSALGTANAAFAVVNNQESGTGAVDAKLQDSLTVRTAITGTVTASSVDSTGNVQEALASSNKAANSLALSATTLNSNGAILNYQDSDAPVTSTIGVTGADAGVVIATADIDSSGIALTDNLVRSSATGNFATNTQNIAATTLTLNAPDAVLAVDDSVNGAFSTLSVQGTSGDVQATTSAGFNVSASGGVTNGSSINNDRNAMTAQAQGAVVANTTTLSVGGTLSQASATGTNVANAAVIANQQSVDGDVLARVDTGSASAAMLTSVNGPLTSSSVSTSNNRTQAFADGASATNALAASATTLTTPAGSSATPGSTAVDVDAAFAVANAQFGGNNTIKAELNDPIPLRTQITGATSSSSVTSTGNMQDAFATSNKATNSITLAATTLTSDGAVVNIQESEAQVSSIIGATAGVGAGAVGADAGVIIDLDDTITGSNIAVTGNMVRGSAISNVGTNTLTASATTLTGDGTNVQATADSDNLATNADFSLGNSQTLGAAATSTTEVYATYGVDVADDKTVMNSQIAVSNNTQFGEALGNSATNRVQLTAVGAGATGNDPTAALNNAQSGLDAAVGATSEMSLYANMASSGSSVALNGNSNTSLGAINNAANTVSVSGLAVDGSTGLASVNVTSNVTTADYALNNNQDASGTLTSTAKTTAYNLDNLAGDPTTTGISNGSASLSRNTTTAEASSNRVTNSLAVSATDNGATAALGNEQFSSAGVTATASSSSYKLDLTTAVTATYAANASSVAVEGNTTTALARGNSASNALNYNVNVAYTGIATDPTFGATTAASAGAVVLNAQTNNGGVAANANSVVYAVGLAGTGTGASGSALNSSASLGNNTTSAVAFGNAATNTLTMATWSAGIPSSAISSNQVNGGAVTATATGVGYTMTPTGPASGSMFRNSGNSISAQAIGNSSVSTIGGGN